MLPPLLRFLGHSEDSVGVFFFFRFFSFCFPSPERFQHRGPRPNYVLLRGIAGANAVTQGILTEGLICSDVFAGSGSAPVDSADGEQQTRSRRAAKTKGPFFFFM